MCHSEILLVRENQISCMAKLFLGFHNKSLPSENNSYELVNKLVSQEMNKMTN